MAASIYDMDVDRITEWTKHLQSLRSLTDDGCWNPYACMVYYDVYLKKSNEEERSLEWFKENFGKEVLQYLRGSYSDEDGDIRMLAVGCGQGVHEIEFLEQLTSAFVNVSCTAVEPSATGIDKFKEALRSQRKLDHVHFEWHQEKLENFRSKLHDQSHKYHVISAMHSLYFVDNLEDTTDFLLSVLTEDGVLIVTLTAADTFFHRTLTDKPWLGNIVYMTTSQSVCDVVEARSGYSVHQVLDPMKIDITTVFRDDSEEGAAMLDFLTSKRHFSREAPPEIKTNLLEYFRSPGISVKSEGGSIHLEGAQGILIIKKKGRKIQ